MEGMAIKIVAEISKLGPQILAEGERSKPHKPFLLKGFEGKKS